MGVPIAKQRHPCSLLWGSRQQRPLGAFVVAVKIAPPQCGDEEQRQYNGDDCLSIKGAARRTNSYVDHRFAQRQDDDQPMTLDKISSIDQEAAITAKEGRDHKKG